MTTLLYQSYQGQHTTHQRITHYDSRHNDNGCFWLNVSCKSDNESGSDRLGNQKQCTDDRSRFFAKSAF